MLFLYDTRHGSTEQIVSNIIEGIHGINKNIKVEKFNREFENIKWGLHKCVFIAFPTYQGGAPNTIINLFKDYYNILKDKTVVIITVGMMLNGEINNPSYTKLNGEMKESLITQYKKVSGIDSNVFDGFNILYFKGITDVNKLSYHERKVMSSEVDDLKTLGDGKFTKEQIDEHKKFGNMVAAKGEEICEFF